MLLIIVNINENSRYKIIFRFIKKMFIELQNLGESIAFNSKEHLMYMNIYIYI